MPRSRRARTRRGLANCSSRTRSANRASQLCRRANPSHGLLYVLAVQAIVVHQHRSTSVVLRELGNSLDRPSATTHDWCPRQLCRVDLDSSELQLRGQPSTATEHVSRRFQQLRFQSDLIAATASVDVSSLCNLKHDCAPWISFHGVLRDTQRRRQQRPVRVIHARPLDRLVNIGVAESLVEQPMHHDRLGDVAKLVEVGRATAKQRGLDEPVSSPLPNPISADARESARTKGREDACGWGRLRWGRQQTHRTYILPMPWDACARLSRLAHRTSVAPLTRSHSRSSR